MIEDNTRNWTIENAIQLNKDTDHISLLTDHDENGPTKHQFLLRQGWVALIYRDLRLVQKMKFKELSNLTGYSSQMWRNLMKANYSVVDSIKKTNLVSDKFISVVTQSLSQNGYFVDTKKMVNLHKKTGAMVRMFWENGKCVSVLVQNSSKGKDVSQNSQLVVNLRRKNDCKRKSAKILLELDHEIIEQIIIQLIVKQDQEGKLYIVEKSVNYNV